jgi:hypothetical protein
MGVVLDGRTLVANAEMSGKDTEGRPLSGPGNGRGSRCKLHGGKSTGPRTEAGKRRSSKAAVEGLRRYWDKRWAESSSQ